MQRLLAIDCSDQELNFVLASAAGGRITLEASATIPVMNSAENRPLSSVEMGQQLQVALSPHKRSGARVLALVDRSAIELFEFSLPPATDAELAELVLNQIATQSPTLGDDAVIDFVPNSKSISEPREITAVALLKAELDRVQTICSTAGVAPDRLLMRPYETAALILKNHAPETGAALVVNVAADEADLIVVNQTRPLFFRTVRLPDNFGTESAETRLVDEIRRTLLIAPQSGSVSESIVAIQLIGTSPEHERVAGQLSETSSVEVKLVDPLASFQTGKEWSTSPSGRMVPLLGMLIQETQGDGHAIDFLHPRRPAKPQNRLRQYAVALGAVGLLAGGAAYYLWDTFSAADAEIQRLAEELADLDKLVKKTAEKKKVIDAIDDWNTNTVVWLDELRDLSSKFPSGQDLVLQRLTLSPARGGRANVAFQGLARDPNVVTRMEEKLRDNRHEVQTPRVDERVQDKSYTWNFETLVSLATRRPETVMASDDDSTTSSANRSRKGGGIRKGTAGKSSADSEAPQAKSGSQSTSKQISRSNGSKPGTEAKTKQSTDDPVSATEDRKL